MEVDPSLSTEIRSAEVNVVYTYSGGTLTDQFTVTQAVLQVDTDYVILNPFVAGNVASMMGMAYFNLIVSEEEIPEDMNLPYNPDYIYYVISIFDFEDGRPLPGIYEIGSGKCTVAAYGTPDAPYYNSVSSGAIIIGFKGDTMSLTANMTDSYGKTHYIGYEGAPRFE